MLRDVGAGGVGAGVPVVWEKWRRLGCFLPAELLASLPRLRSGRPSFPAGCRAVLCCVRAQSCTERLWEDGQVSA